MGKLRRATLCRFRGSVRHSLEPSGVGSRGITLRSTARVQSRIQGFSGLRSLVAQAESNPCASSTSAAVVRGGTSPHPNDCPSFEGNPRELASFAA